MGSASAPAALAAAVLAAATSLAVLVGWATAGAAAAQTACETVVEDRAGELDAEATTRIGEAVADLREAGAQPYVRLLDTTPAGIDAWFEDALVACPSWQGAGGRRAPDLLVLAVSLGDRRTGTYYGDELAGRLDDRWPAVHETMADRLRDGQHEVALTTGLRTYAVLLGGAGTSADGVQPLADPSGGGLPDGVPELVVIGGVVAALGGALALNRRHGRSGLSGSSGWRDTSGWSDGGGWSDSGGGDSGGGGGDGGGGSSGW